MKHSSSLLLSLCWLAGQVIVMLPVYGVVHGI